MLVGGGEGEEARGDAAALAVRRLMRAGDLGIGDDTVADEIFLTKVSQSKPRIKSAKQQAAARQSLLDTQARGTKTGGGCSVSRTELPLQQYTDIGVALWEY